MMGQTARCSIEQLCADPVAKVRQTSEDVFQQQLVLSMHQASNIPKHDHEGLVAFNLLETRIRKQTT